MAKAKMVDGVVPQPKRKGKVRTFNVKIGLNPWNWTHVIDKNMGRISHSKTKEVEVFLINGDSIRLKMTGEEFMLKYAE